MRRRLKAIYLMHSIDGFAASLVGIFVPVYLLALGYPLRQVLFFYIMIYAALAAFFFLAGYSAGHFGLKRTILFRLPFLMAYLLMLYFLPTHATPLWLIALAGGLNLALYWFPLHIIFTRASEHDEMGNNVGKLLALPKFAGIFAPLLGGFFAAAFGFGPLFIFAIILYFVSAIPLMYADELKQTIEMSRGKAVQIFRRLPKYFLAEAFGNAAGVVEAVIWPAFIYLSFKNILSVGALGTLLGLGGALVTLLVGRYSDRVDKKIFLRLGAALLIAVWFSRYFGQNEILFYVLTILSGFFSILIAVPFTSIAYATAKKDDGGASEFIIVRELAVNAGRVLIFLLGMFLVENIKLTFLLSGLANVYFFFF